MAGGYGVAIRWVARVWAAAVTIPVAAFLAEHLGWLRGGVRPPPWVLAALGFHSVVLVGLLLGWRWEVLGACLTLTGAIGFMMSVGGGWRILAVVSVVCGPALLWLCVRWLGVGRASGA